MGHPATVLFVFLALSLSHVRYVHPFVSNPPMFPSKTEQFMNYLFARIILHENTKKKERKRRDVHGLLFQLDSQPGPNGHEINDGSKTQSSGGPRRGKHNVEAVEAFSATSPTAEKRGTVACTNCGE
jgi:hypothetical protein